MAAERVDVAVADRVLSVSSPTKQYFPELGEAGRKIAVVEYVLAVGEHLLRAVAHRPTYLQRFPDGIAGEEVYQKRLPPRAPYWLARRTVTFPSRRSAEALSPTSVADLVWAVQMGTITFHPWPSRDPDVEHPDRLRIDLDPQPGTSFADARAVAIDLVQPLLDEVGLVGFPKTSGGRGLHVDVPIEPRWTFLQARRCVLAIAREMERRDPARVTSAWWKEERGSRIFIDFNQMLRDKTIAAAYSLRATPAATASTPVTWEELPAVTTEDFDIRTVPERMRRHPDPQRAMDASAGSLEPLLEWVARDEGNGVAEAPYPPNYPKMPGEPPRVQPSKKNALNWKDSD
ncbi:MAG: ATP-dependent DNA ligase [Actinomycetota bacterium]|nr:ATP-dependent DNA ligase [Actinomycetota bacterium]